DYPPQLQAGRNSRSQRHHLVVEKRYPYLRRRRHAHLVGVGEVETRKKSLEVEVEDPVQPVGGRRTVEVLPMAVKRIMVGELIANVCGEKTVELGTAVVRAVDEIPLERLGVEAPQRLHQVPSRPS